MAEKKPDENKQPPKMDLNGKGQDTPKKKDLPKELLTKSSAKKAPPKVRTPTDTQKQETSEIEIPKGIPSKAKSETTKISISDIDLEEDKKTTGSKLPPVSVSAKRIPDKPKKETTKVF